MSTLFEDFGIRHLSASSLNKWSGCRGAWVAHYLYGLKGSIGPAAWRGGAVEDGLTAYVTKADIDPLEFAMRTFERDAQGDLDDAVDAERQLIKPMLEQAIAAWEEAGLDAPKSKQIKTECWFDGVHVPMIGYADYIMDGYTLDLKTTKRLPSKPSFNHVLQVAGYAHARNEARADLLYVTGKKRIIHTVGPEEIEEAVADLHRRAIGLQETLKSAWLSAGGDIAKAKEQIARMCPPNADTFYWDDDSLAEALGTVWKEAA